MCARVIARRTLTEPVKAVRGPFESCGDIGAAATARRSRQNSPVSVCESVCGEDLSPHLKSDSAIQEEPPPRCRGQTRAAAGAYATTSGTWQTPRGNAKVSVRKLTSLSRI